MQLVTDYGFTSSRLGLDHAKPGELHYGSDYILRYTLDATVLKEKNFGSMTIEVSFGNLSASKIEFPGEGTPFEEDGRTGFRIAVTPPDLEAPKHFAITLRLSLAGADITKDADFKITVSVSKRAKIENASLSFSLDVAEHLLDAPGLIEEKGESVQFAYVEGADYYTMHIQEENTGYTADKTAILRGNNVYVIDGLVTDVVSVDLDDPAIAVYVKGSVFSYRFAAGGDFVFTCTAHSSDQGYLSSATSTITVRT